MDMLINICSSYNGGVGNLEFQRIEGKTFESGMNVLTRFKLMVVNQARMLVNRPHDSIIVRR